jgi:hypothetical protein
VNGYRVGNEGKWSPKGKYWGPPKLCLSVVAMCLYFVLR